MENPEKLYSLKECLAWIEIYFNKLKDGNPDYVGNRPFWYVEYGRRELKRAQQSVYLTAFGVGMLAFLAGFGICWLVFVR